MKAKGFTLIELLAVIVILAIIALIATPIILGIINSAKKESNQRSAELYLKSAELAIARANLNGEVGNTVCTVQNNGNLSCTGVSGEIKVDVDGTIPEAGSKITFTNGKITNLTSYTVGDTTYKLQNGSLVLDDGSEEEGENSCYVYKTEEITYTGINASKCVPATKQFFELMGEDISEVPDSFFEGICDGTGDMQATDMASEYETYVYLLYANDGLEGVNVTQELENATILRYTCDDTDVEIPSTLGGKNVTEIGEDAFAGTGVTSVVIPNTVTTIGHNAFCQNQLNDITIPSSVTTIDSTAFAYNSLESVTIPNSVTTIGEEAFAYNNIDSIIIGSGITDIGERAFGCYDSDRGYGPNVVDSVSIDKLENDSNLSIGLNAFCWINNKTNANIDWK